MFRFHWKLLRVSQSVPAGAQVSMGMPTPKVASFMIASLSRDKAIALRTRTSEVGANCVFNTSCLIPAMPIRLAHSYVGGRRQLRIQHQLFDSGHANRHKL